MRLSHAQAMWEEALPPLARWAWPGPQTGWQRAGRHWEMSRICSKEMTWKGWLPDMFAGCHILTLLSYLWVGPGWSTVWKNITYKWARQDIRRLTQGIVGDILLPGCRLIHCKVRNTLWLKRLIHTMVEVERDLLRSSCHVHSSQAESPRAGCPGQYNELQEKAIQCAQLSQKDHQGDFQWPQDTCAVSSSHLRETGTLPYVWRAWKK